jgi:hypothetical protein
LAKDISDTIAHSTAKETENATFYRLHSDRMFVDFTAASCLLPDEKEKRVQLSGNVVVVESDAATKQRLRTLRAQKAIIHLEGDELVPALTMEIYNPTWQQADGSEHLAAGRVRIRGLVLPKSVTDKCTSEDILKEVSSDSIASTLQQQPGKKLKELQTKLQAEIQFTLSEIKAEVHSRLVFGIGCVALILIGIGLGIILKGGHLLSAFGASSVPAAALVVFIMMGRNITKNVIAHAGSGILFMWAGLVLLSILAVGIYHKLLKN